MENLKNKCYSLRLGQRIKNSSIRAQTHDYSHKQDRSFLWVIDIINIIKKWRGVTIN